MSKRLFHILLVVCVLVMASAATAAGQADDAPTITSFATTVSRVDPVELAAGAARVPVTWVSINRPITANLFFEQVLPDGSVENVELPREIAWVSSSGSGVVAPKWPGEGETEIVLQVRLVDTETDEVLDKREITVEIGPGTGDTPYIASFGTTNPTTNVLQLTAGSARIPVSWIAVNRPLTANLVFEQVMPDGSAVNVELPRDNPWVNSSGEGMVAPEYPGEGVDYLTIRLRLFDLITSAEYDRATFRVDILPEAEPVITTFTTTMTAVDRGRLSQRIERVPVSWVVEDRPPNSNLAFEQVMPDDTVKNVELPRDNPWVSSAGDGLAAPYAPGEGETEIVLQLRLFDLTTNFVYDTRQITLPVEDVTGAGNIATFNTSATGVNAAQLAAHTARVPVSWVVDSRPSNSNLVFEQVLDDGTIANVELPRDILVVPSIGQGIAAPYLPGGDAAEIHLQLRLIDLDTEEEYDKAEITLPIEGGVAPPRITSFEVSTTALKVSELQAETARVPCTWTVENRPSNTNLVFEQRLPGAEVVNVELPRSNPIVPSTGVGTMAPVYPGDGEETAVFRLRLIDLSTDVTLHFSEVSLPIIDDTGEEPADGDVAITSFTVTPDVAAPDDVVTIAWETENADSVELLVGEMPVEAPELSGSITRTGSELSAGPGEVVITLSAIDADDPDNPVVETRTVTVQPPADLEPQIVSFSAEPTSAAPGETVTLSWETLNAAGVALSWAGADALSPESALSVTGSFVYAVPDDAAIGSITFTLTVTGEDGSTIAQNVTVEVTAPAGEGDGGGEDDTGDDADGGDTGDDAGGEGDDAGEGEGEPLGEEDGD